jgi:3-oxoacyl-[acyl-carrier protein] reductase
MGTMEGRVALVTGASRGIGRAIVMAMAERGATVMAAARGDHAQAVVEEIRGRGGAAEAVSLDVTDAAGVSGAVAAIVARTGRLDVLVNNAGITRDQLMLRMKRQDWDAVIDTNLTGAFTCAQAVLRTMVKQRSGRIINVTSVVGQAGNAGQANYAAAKAGLIGFTKSLALEVASRGVTVNAVAPGLIDTDMTRALSSGAQDEWTQRIPLQRLGTTADVAAAVMFLASDEASYITGHVLAVNGGMYL